VSGACCLLRSPHSRVAALCAGVAGANLARPGWPAVVFLSGLTLFIGLSSVGAARALAVALGCLLAGWWWGGLRLTALDRSVLVGEVDRAERSVLVVTAPARRARFQLRIFARAERFGRVSLNEPVLLELPLGRAPPQGARLELVAEVNLPRGPKDGFDERAWLRRHGVHVILRADRWKMVGRRGGVGGVADRVRVAIGRSMAPGLRGERRAILDGVVLGDDGNLPEELRDRFRASGLYHLLAVSGQNVALVAGGVLMTAWLVGIPRWLGQMGALGAIFAYVLAVGAQPSVVRAGIAGALTSLAWLAARAADRWYFLLLGALALLAWSPYSLFDPGFQLSFAAVAAIFVLVPRLRRVLEEGYPVPSAIAEVVTVSAACGAVTAPILWLQFHAVPLLTVPANALAAPVVAPLLGLALAAAAIYPLSPTVAGALGWLNGWCAAYLAACARLVGGLPGAQISSGHAALALLVVAVAGGAYAWHRWPKT
jgi:competence protein ComEC